MPKIKKRGDNRYSRTLVVDGRRIYVYGTTQDEADTKWLKLKNEKEAGLHAGNKMTLDEWMVSWYDVYKRGKGALKTQEMYQYAINNYLHPALGQKRIKDIKPMDIQMLLNAIPGKSTAHIIKITANQIFRTAIANGYCLKNPCADAKLNPSNAPKRAVLSEIQRNILLEAIKGKQTFPFILTMLCTGMRMGEAIALQRDDVDFERHLIHITKAVEFKAVMPIEKGPKTKAGNRYVPIPDDLLVELQKHLASHQSKYVFPGPRGTMFSKTSIDNWFRSIKRDVLAYFAKHPDMKPHSFNLNYRMLRHTYATALYDAEIDPKMAQEVMGHTDIKITLGIYTHIQEARRADSIGKISKLYYPEK